jgi:hypothetical protein
MVHKKASEVVVEYGPKLQDIEIRLLEGARGIPGWFIEIYIVSVHHTTIGNAQLSSESTKLHKANCEITYLSAFWKFVRASSGVSDSATPRRIGTETQDILRCLPRCLSSCRHCYFLSLFVRVLWRYWWLSCRLRSYRKALRRGASDEANLFFGVEGCSTYWTTVHDC